MSVYRSESGGRGVRTVRVGLPATALAMLFGMLVAAGGLAWLLSSGVVLDCSRADGACVITRVVGPRVVLSRESVALASVERAVVLEKIVDEGTRLEAVALVRGGGTAIPIESFSNVGLGRKREWEAGLNAFLGSSSRAVIHREDVSQWPFWVWVLAAVLMGVTPFASATTVVVDHERGVVTIRRGALGPASGVPLSTVARAFLHEEVDGRGARTTALALERTDGSRLDLTGHSSLGMRRKRRDRKSVV